MDPGRGGRSPRNKPSGCARRALQFFAVAIAVALFIPLKATAEGCPSGTVYLTFDTGSMRSAELIAQTLREENVKATFFLANEPTFRGDHSLDPSWDGYWKQLAQDGHRFGNHTWSHTYARRDEGGKVIADNGRGGRVVFDRAGYCNELARVDRAFTRATGQRLSGLWRAPGWATR